MTTQNSVQKIIFDTDPGIDDAMALLFIEASPALDLVAVTTVFGNADIDTTTRNALYLKDRFGLKAPVFKGTDKPLVRPRNPSPTFVHGENGLGDVELTGLKPSRPEAKPAYQAIIDLARENPGEITLVAVGPLTNLALALNADPQVATLLKAVVIMGGAFGVAGKPGNVTPVAEANIWNDPEAADQVFTAPWPVTAVSLDVTTQVVMSPAYMDALEAKAGPAGAFLNAISKPYAAFYGGRDGIIGCCVHDAAAVAFVIDPSLFEVRRGSIRVITDGIALGQTCQKVEGELFGPSAWDDQPIQAITVGVKAEGLLKLYAETMGV
ncbi:nucleoside hydrolase [Caulobacter rhizosphaerae]|jgi:inosine-uridine nucleoside N-ribohydrolase|uniref:nucleoside hydrolase n=1 Tax=Caulobacter rhizosphaerae TaxID=2010972 RepID=UPI0013D1322C|nr:nucleoside hydrolase [Caulobacter rhizosphaerae]GGL46114.1 nucleoside hydrolase [Caulobacter rhizosphaerae]